MSFKSNKPGTAITPAQQTMLDSFVALATTPVGYHLAKDSGGNIVNTADTGGGGGGTPGGSTTQLQYNNAGAFGGISGATSDGTKVTFLSTGFEIADATTNTKKAVFNVASITAATTRTLTVQNSDGTIALLSNNLGQFGSTTSAQLASVISDDTGTGALVFANTPTLVTPILGVATATSINKVAITAPATSATLTIANGKTLTANNTITLAGTDSTTMTFPSTNATIARTDAGQTFTGANTFTSQTKNKSTYQDIVAATDGATITFDLSLGNLQSVTMAGNRTLAISNAHVGQVFMLRLTQDGTGTRVPTWFTTIKWAGGTAPTLTTTASKTDVFGFICTSAGNYDGFVVGQNI